MSLPASYDFNIGVETANLVTIANKLPLRGNALGRAIQSNSAPIVWYLEDGIKKGIPSLLDLRLLNIQPSQIDRIENGAVNELPGAGLKLGVGQIVKANEDAAVYVITSPTSKTWISTAGDMAMLTATSGHM